jgi:hypothetical protein
MSIFGKLANTVRQKVKVKGLVKGVSSQQVIGVNDSAGGKSPIFGGLFNGKKKAVKQQAALEAASKFQARTEAKANTETMGEKASIIKPFFYVVAFGLFVWGVIKLLKK